jgi:tetratricopeptide (TPR) repeat protein
VREVLPYLRRWAIIFGFSFCAAYVVLHAVRQTGWYRDWLYRRLLTSGERQALRVAGELAALGAERHLLAALQAESPTARQYGRRALEYVWFSAAGEEAYQRIQMAYQAAEREDFHEALTLLNQLLDQHPDFAEAWNRRAAVYWSLGLIEKSAADSEQALRLNPRHYGAWQGLGLCRLEQGEVAEAVRCLRAALKIIPHDQPTRESLRRCEELQRTFVPRGKRGRLANVI